METHPDGSDLPHVRSGAVVLVTSLNPSGHCWLWSVMSRLATLVHPPVVLQQVLVMSQYT